MGSLRSLRQNACRVEIIHVSYVTRRFYCFNWDTVPASDKKKAHEDVRAIPGRIEAHEFFKELSEVPQVYNSAHYLAWDPDSAGGEWVEHGSLRMAR
jgi:hypothetical protein